MGGLGILMRRRRTFKPDVFQDMKSHIVAAYNFKGRSNDDADRDVILPYLGGGNMVVEFGNYWGAGDEYTRTGYYDEALSCASNCKGAIINLPILLQNDFTIIVKRAFYSATGLKNNVYTATIGSTGYDDNTQCPLLIEYQSATGAFETNVMGRTYKNRIDDGFNIAWVTPEYYNNAPLAVTTSTHSQPFNILNIGRVRSTLGAFAQRWTMYEIHIFDKTYTPEEIEMYIRRAIDSRYVLPII